MVRDETGFLLSSLGRHRKGRLIQEGEIERSARGKKGEEPRKPLTSTGEQRREERALSAAWKVKKKKLLRGRRINKR